MTEVENLIYQFDLAQREMMLFFHKLFTEEYLLTDKITFKNPCYYKNSWVCYLKALKNGKVEIAFMRGNELSNTQGILKDKGRKQLRSIDIVNLNKALLDVIREIVNEALVLDEAKPYESKRIQSRK